MHDLQLLTEETKRVFPKKLKTASDLELLEVMKASSGHEGINYFWEEIVNSFVHRQITQKHTNPAEFDKVAGQTGLANELLGSLLYQLSQYREATKHLADYTFGPPRKRLTFIERMTPGLALCERGIILHCPCGEEAVVFKEEFIDFRCRDHWSMYDYQLLPLLEHGSS